MKRLRLNLCIKCIDHIFIYSINNLVMCLDLFALVSLIVRRSIEMNVIVYRILVDVLWALGTFVSIRWHVSLMFVDCGLKLISLYSKGIAYLCAWFAYAIHLDRFLQPILMLAMYLVGFLQWLVWNILYWMELKAISKFIHFAKLNEKPIVNTLSNPFHLLYSSNCFYLSVIEIDLGYLVFQLTPMILLISAYFLHFASVFERAVASSFDPMTFRWNQKFKFLEWKREYSKNMRLYSAVLK